MVLQHKGQYGERMLTSEYVAFYLKTDIQCLWSYTVSLDSFAL